MVRWQPPYSTRAKSGGSVQVGDLIRPKCKYNFQSSGYAVIKEMNVRDGNVVIVWVNDQCDHYMRWWQLDEQMEIA
mgnify:CR=1 FL=1